MNISNYFSLFFVAAGTLFFISGTIGLIRMPDIYSRLHALTKGDNLGLGLVILGVIIHQQSWIIAFKLLIVWLLIVTTSASVSHLIAKGAKSKGIKPWKR
jgi:multicomponent Na+:H+ antiporter subunit G